jgi:hypothetical protein
VTEWKVPCYAGCIFFKVVLGLSFRIHFDIHVLEIKAVIG